MKILFIILIIVTNTFAFERDREIDFGLNFSFGSIVHSSEDYYVGGPTVRLSGESTIRFTSNEVISDNWYFLGGVNIRPGRRYGSDELEVKAETAVLPYVGIGYELEDHSRMAFKIGMPPQGLWVNNLWAEGKESFILSMMSPPSDDGMRWFLDFEVTKYKDDIQSSGVFVGGDFYHYFKKIFFLKK